ncbi:MAG: ABC transporter permease [Eubacteriaceae bacterium]|nr:ABC transporter permease [Eubacteriaceae bacterium]
MSTWIAFWNILKKDMKNYYLMPSNVNWGIFFPVSWTLTQFIRSSGNIDVLEFLPGLMAVSVLFATTSMLSVTITFERKGRSFERLLLAPLSLNALLLAKITGTILFGLFIASVPVLLASFFVSLSGVNWGMAYLSVLLIALTSTLIGLVIAVSAKEVFEAQMMSNFFRFPMMFLCGTMMPVQKLPALLRIAAYCLPLTYGTDILNRSITGASALPPLACIFALAVFSAILFGASRYTINNKWIS